MLTGGERVEKESRFGKKLKDPGFMEKVVKRRFEKRMEMPSYMNRVSALDLLYRRLAREIPIRVESYGEQLEFPVVGYGKKESTRVTRKVGIGEYGKLVFIEPKHHWSIPIAVKKGIGGIPNLYFILDCSSSMIEGGGKMIDEWGDESKYHYALLGVYGVLNYLERVNFIPSKIGLTSFSTGSRSGVYSSGKLKKMKEILFSPEFGTTWVNISQIRNVSKQLGKGVIIMVSDGEIWNWEDVSRELKQILKNNYSVFISIKEKSRPYKELQGITKVIHVKRESDLTGVMIDFTRRSYGEVI